MATEGYNLVNNVHDNRFEFNIDGEVAFINYLRQRDVYYLIHTQVPETMQGRGIAAALVEKTFKFMEEGGFKMMPYCPYVQSYLERHPGWEKLVSED